MISLTPTDSARIVLALIQHMRRQTNAGPNFTLANLATLLAVCENPGSLQPDIGTAVGGLDGATLTRHLNMLGGIKRTDSDSAMEPLVRTDRNMMNRRLNDVFLTPSGVKFTEDLAEYFNRLLARTADRKK